MLVGIFAALVLAGGVSYFASSAPDGLDATTLKGCTVDEATGEITGGQCIAQTAKEHELAGSWLGDYGISGIEGTTGVAGVIGVVITFAIGLAIFWGARRRRARGESAPSTSETRV
ncbi:PDGLE domain-containing protein [Allorhizocola rhizosphaerae]|uniref:PDGLE domain-containing protein n=1 Tax=Allorhizocola rhizosphaerae TaxID=1872709 RepID=UPI00319DDEB4